MSAVDISLFSDVAKVLRNDPAIIEKDYWVTQCLSILSKLEITGYQLVLSGGTCLAKAHCNTFRMSEDIDIKLVPLDTTLCLSQSRQRQLKRVVQQAVIHAIAQSTYFSLIQPPKIRNVGKYQQFLIAYPQHYSPLSALRSHLQLELTESRLLEPAVALSLDSLYANTLRLDKEIDVMDCVSVESIACEKFVSILRRTALHARDSTRPDDATLIRHVYDLHLIYALMPKPAAWKNKVAEVIALDCVQFGNKHAALVQDPITELQYGLALLVDQSLHKQRYAQFIGPLVYHPAPASWDTALKSVQSLADYWL